MAHNPYAPPQAALEDFTPEITEAETTRRANLLHEVRLKSVGLLYYLSAALFGLGSLAAVVIPGRTDAPGLLYMLFVLGIAVLLGALGYGYRRLRPWIRIPGGVLAGLGLLAVPIGTLINGYILYLLFSAKGRTVLAPEYAQVVAATPRVKYRRGVGDWIAIGLLIVLVLGTFYLLTRTIQ